MSPNNKNTTQMAVATAKKGVTTHKLKNGLATVELDITYTHHPYAPGDRNDPPQEEYVEIERAFYNTQDVTDLLDIVNPDWAIDIAEAIKNKI